MKLEKNDLATAVTLHELGLRMRDARRYDEAVEVFGKALEIKKAELGENDLEVAVSLHELGLCMWDARRYDEAEEVLRQALEIRKAELGDDNLEVAVTLHVLGLCVLDAGRHDDAEAVLRDVLKIMKDQPGEDNIQFFNTLHDLGLCLWDAGQHDEAEEILRKALEIKKAKLGKDHIEVAFTTHVLGVCIRDAGQHDKAEGVLRQALNIKKAQLGEDDLQIAVTLHELGVCMCEVGRYDEAEEVLRKALEIQKAKLGKGDLDVAFTLHVLGVCIRDAGQHDEGERLLSQALEMTRSKLATATESERQIGNKELMNVESALTGVELVQQFDYHKSMFSTENASVRLNVHPGCLEEGQAAGPITVFTDKIYVVESGKQRFFVSVVVDCQPSGIKFNLPLSFDFRVGGPPGQEREGADSSDDEGTCVLSKEEREEYVTYLRDSYKVSGFYIVHSQKKNTFESFPRHAHMQFYLRVAHHYIASCFASYVFFVTTGFGLLILLKPSGHCESLMFAVRIYLFDRYLASNVGLSVPFNFVFCSLT